eukprot:g82444.t1
MSFIYKAETSLPLMMPSRGNDMTGNSAVTASGTSSSVHITAMVTATPAVREVIFEPHSSLKRNGDVAAKTSTILNSVPNVRDIMLASFTAQLQSRRGTSASIYRKKSSRS